MRFSSPAIAFAAANLGLSSVIAAQPCESLTALCIAGTLSGLAQIVAHPTPGQTGCDNVTDSGM
ncbi:hypothetical protein EST38_g12213 [Candolleomyces aberdarensis]|uniref:Hydrophobin n=1 Tax=Candolleomyces aberdarensis TaxID=2316362 RepID=A0A4Q2D4H1_9AGAR|nr:hypothetical protein EST38_g12213 [Candolleomyces aberdarensis]